jgi:hypothetical protein
MGQQSSSVMQSSSGTAVAVSSSTTSLLPSTTTSMAQLISSTAKPVAQLTSSAAPSTVQATSSAAIVVVQHTPSVLTSSAAAISSAVTSVVQATSSLTTSLAQATPLAAAAAAITPQAAVSSAPLTTIVPTVLPKHGPFISNEAVLGGVPTTSVDVPITIIFLILFVSGAIFHFTRHELNSKKGHKFHLSDMIFDFCMVRTVTCIMRIVWATRPTNPSIVLAALIFENAGYASYHPHVYISLLTSL